MARQKKYQKFAPAFEGLVTEIKRRIYDSVYRPDDKLPSVRELAEEFGVGRQVAHYALQRLAAHDFITMEPKRGAFVNHYLNTRLHYRLGLAINDNNPVHSGTTISGFFDCASQNMFACELISNYRRKTSIVSLLEEDREYDGLLIGGYVEEKLLTAVRRLRIPYLVFGNYEISPDHPQYTRDWHEFDTILPGIFRKFSGRKIAAMLGTAEWLADRQCIEKIRNLIHDAGGVNIDRLIKSCEGDGYAECIALMAERPALLYVHGDAFLGYRKYRAKNPDGHRPYTVINTSSRNFLAGKDICDESVNLNWGEKASFEATRQLIGMILALNGKKEKRHE